MSFALADGRQRCQVVDNARVVAVIDALVRVGDHQLHACQAAPDEVAEEFVQNGSASEDPMAVTSDTMHGDITLENKQQTAQL